jgi:diadenosine tetraphosphate (Ap4A) HIT family hydrolase
MNETLKKFGYPENVIAEYGHWAVLLRPKQVTAGSLILACKESATGFPLVSAAAYTELPEVTGQLEAALRRCFEFEKINYLALMMVDKEVHFHVLPRYSGPRQAVGAVFHDRDWPTAPDITRATALTEAQFAALRTLLKDHW